jgi:hypothetical protein
MDALSLARDMQTMWGVHCVTVCIVSSLAASAIRVPSLPGS